MGLPRLDVPTYELVLPSTNKKIKYRPFLVKEHKILLTMMEASDDEITRIVHELVDSCTFNALKVSELPHFDVEYIFTHLRAKSISEIVNVVVTCKNCNENYDASFNLENIKVEKNSKHSNKIMLTQDIGIEMKYPKFEDVIKILDSNDTSVVFSLVKKSITGIFQGDQYWNTNEQTDEEIDEFLNTLTKEQFVKIEEFFQSSPKVVQEFESTCSKCSTVNNSRIEGIQNFFV